MQGYDFPKRTLSTVLHFKNGKSIKPGGTGFYPVYGANGIIGGSEEYREANAIIVGRVGAYCGSVNYCAGKFWASDNTIVASPVDSSDDVRFYWYLLRYLNLNRWAGGAAQPLLTQTVLNRIEAPIPHSIVQRKIADILSAYDDLIENNTRRIKILEEMAQAIYREWFVKYRFPGHEQVAMVETELGLVPDGWQRVALGQIAEINARSIRGSDWPGIIHYVDISSVSTGQIDTITDMRFDEAPGRARRILRHGDTIWSCVRPNRKSYSLIISPTENMIASTGFAVVSPVSVPYTFLHQSVTTDEFVAYLTNHARGAAYPAVTAEDFEHAIVQLPDPGLTHQYHAAVEPMFLLKHSLQKRNNMLRHTRDLLLPKLVSGEVDVSGLEVSS